MAVKFIRKCFISILETPIGGEDEIIKQIWGYDQEEATAGTPLGLRVSFIINKQLSDVSDNAVVKIYNLNQESRKALAQRSIYIYKTSKVRTLQISAGYKDDFGALFNGGIERVINTREGPDWVTEIKASSALAQILHNVLDKNWESDAGTPFKTIADEAFSSLAGVDKVSYSVEALSLISSITLPSFSANGSAYKTVQNLMRGIGLAWTIDSKEAKVVIPSNPLNAANSYLVDETSGLIGSPKVDDMGYEFRTLIDHNITTGTLVFISSQTLEASTPGLDALATAWTLEVRGDTHEDDWYMDVKTLFYPPIIKPAELIGNQPPIKEPEAVVL